MNIYSALKSDHDKVKALLSELVSLSEGDEKRFSTLVAKIRDELIPHSRAEEAVFYNSIREVDIAKNLVWEGYEEHMAAEALLRSLQAVNKVDVQSKKLAEKLKAALEHHIQEEESEIFSAAKQLFTAEESTEMGRAFQSLKSEVKEGSIIQTTLDTVANMMPVRLARPLRSFIYHP